MTSTGSPRAADVGKDLVDLGRVAVPVRRCRPKSSRCTRGSGTVNFGDRPAPETPLLASITIPVRSIRFSANQRGQRQDACRGVTAGVGDSPAGGIDSR